MFRANVRFRSTTGIDEFSISKIFKLQVDGEETLPKDLQLGEAKTITFTYHQPLLGSNPQKLLGSVVFNASDIVYIDMMEEID
ncbi:hypothetical protein [Ligilactobacillus saerimneri]|uniref:hypothetical protein n=1 Tax=Ligilactobacillus saerimneri TaxID=228229 RepID=UPI001C0F8A1B|nr:hypothetical protein [Ligilactobacillus saerimneri]MBU5309273.1 hypothetical protein [Ligilactobacillus saerimneri]